MSKYSTVFLISGHGRWMSGVGLKCQNFATKLRPWSLPGWCVALSRIIEKTGTFNPRQTKQLPRVYLASVNYTRLVWFGVSKHVPSMLGQGTVVMYWVSLSFWIFESQKSCLLWCTIGLVKWLNPLSIVRILFDTTSDYARVRQQLWSFSITNAPRVNSYTRPQLLLGSCPLQWEKQEPFGATLQQSHPLVHTGNLCT